MRSRFKQYWLLLFLSFFHVSTGANAAAANGDVRPANVKSVVVQPTNQNAIQIAINKAEELQLAQHEVWFALLHYKRETLLWRFISQADDEDFFLDEEGKTDPHAELLADIKAFLHAPQTGHAQCLFPARWWWLKQQLELSDQHDVVCPKLEAYMERFSHQKLFVVFPSMYLNNPGSTFGHTFLRFDDDDESILLSRTLNYAAHVDQSDDVVSYISKGLLGGYTGFFRARAYYETVQEYNNIENRDIWEYQLDFTPDEIEQLVRHIWEVKDIDFDYYFFRENCSYRLLALLDVMRPGISLTGEDDFPLYAIPVDTVRALDDAGLVLSRTFRPSLATQIDDFFYSETDGRSDVVLAIVSEDMPGEKNSLNDALQGLASDEKKRVALQQSYNVLQFAGKSASPKAQAILQLINELPPSSPSEKTAIGQEKFSPEKGHESARVSLGYGEQNNRRYIDLRFRTAFHDLLDAPQGFVDGATINVFDVRLKGFDDNIRLESLSLFNVTSLSPLRRWRKPVSWMFDFRFDRTQMNQLQSVRNFISRGGVGFSYRQQAVTSYALLVGEWNLSSAYGKGYSLLLGMQAGVHIDLGASRFLLSYEAADAAAGFELDRNVTLMQWQYNLQVNHAVRASYRRTQYDFYDDEDWILDYNYYF